MLQWSLWGSHLPLTGIPAVVVVVVVVVFGDGGGDGGGPGVGPGDGGGGGSCVHLPDFAVAVQTARARGAVPCSLPGQYLASTGVELKYPLSHVP